MKQSISHKVFSIILSLVVLVSTLSLTIQQHFCGGVLIDVAVFTEVEKCSDDIINISDGTNEVLKKSCCKDEIDVFEGLSDITINKFEDLDDIQKQVLYAYTYSYVALFESIPKLTIPHKDYSSVTLIKDIHVLDETYLIGFYIFSGKLKLLVATSGLISIIKI